MIFLSVSSLLFVGRRTAILVTEIDMTHRAKMESLIADVSEVQLSLLSNVFPRHIIEFLSGL